MTQHAQHRYKVKKGDTLWHIAGHHYGDPTLWPAIAKANHIPDGNLILIGMHLNIPPHPHRHHAPVHPHPAPVAPKAPAGNSFSASATMAGFPPAVPVAFPAVKFKLDTLPPMIHVDAGLVEYKLKLIGELTVQEANPLAEVEIAHSGTVSEKLKAEYRSKVSRVAGQFKVKWDFAALTAEVSCGFTVASKVNGKEFVSHTFDYIPPNKYKYTLKPKDVEGTIDKLVYKGTLGYELEITKKDFRRNPSTAMVPVPGLNRTVTWVAVGFLVVGVTVLAADIIKDIASAGTLSPTSPVAWTFAMSMFERAATAH